MRSSSWLGKVFVALGICMTMLSFDAFVNESEGGCAYCSLVNCESQAGFSCNLGACTGTLCLSCSCKQRPLDPMRCTCQE